MPHLRRAAATLAVAAVALSPSLLGLSRADATPASPVSPGSDPFYSEGAGALASLAPGHVIGSRTVGLTLNDINGKTAGFTGTQLVYRTQNELGDPSETVTTVIRPAGVSRGVVAYLSYYDGLGDTCDPSYTLRNPSPGTEKFIIDALVSNGYTVTVPDFEGESLDWAAGHEAGWDTLDAIRATESSLGLPAATTPVGMMGYSGGSIAGDWASELAASYAPELHLVATAIGGVPANLGDVMNYVDSTADVDRDKWAGVIPAAMVSLGRANDEDLVGEYASTTDTYPEADPTESGTDIAHQVSDECIGDFAGGYPGLHVKDLLADPSSDFLAEPDVAPIVARNEMGTGGTPRMPMLIVQGKDDDTGDGVMVTADVQALADKYRAEGVSVRYTELDGQSHEDAGNTFVLSGLGFLNGLIPMPHPAAPPARARIHAKLKGHSAGRKDVLVVIAKGATGAKVKLFRGGHKKAIGHGKVKKNGKVTIKVTDRNGRAKTRYHAVVAATATTMSATTKVVRLR